ncbi:hypothetical protein HC891_21725 [Candidatus Gracilibacteria bacterium]|nr:hypothetical protein [Candidatus Gracilibacteria bacterium]
MSRSRLGKEGRQIGQLPGIALFHKAQGDLLLTTVGEAQRAERRGVRTPLALAKVRSAKLAVT